MMVPVDAFEHLDGHAEEAGDLPEITTASASPRSPPYVARRAG